MSLPVFEEAADAARLRAMRADAAAVCDYGMMLSAAVLESFPRGALNIHPSLLPRWRGPEPIVRAILEGDNETGVCIMQLDEGMDTGAILLRERVAISPTITGGELSEALAKIGARLLLRALSENPAPQAQSGEPIEAKKIAAAERELDFRLKAEELARRVRAFAPSPSAFACLPDGERIKIIAAEVAERKPEWATMQSGDIAADASGAIDCDLRRKVAVAFAPAASGKKTSRRRRFCSRHAPAAVVCAQKARAATIKDCPPR